MIQGILDKLKDLFYKNSKKFRNTETNFSKTQGFANSELENVGQKTAWTHITVSLCLFPEATHQVRLGLLEGVKLAPKTLQVY